MKKINKSLLSFVLAIILVLSCIANISAENLTQKNDVVSIYGAGAVKNYFANLTIQMADTYYYGVEDEDLLYRALCSTIDLGYFDLDAAVSKMMGILDDGYSEFYTSERFDTLYTGITGEYYGIGVEITLSGDHVVVAGIFPNSPAEKGGIKTYDIIVSVDGTDVKGMSTADIAALIKREKGEKVNIGVLRDGEMLSIDCFCDEVSQNPVVSSIIEDGKIGYIYISTFSANLKEFMDPIMQEFNEKGIKNIILDIRNNGGGEINAAIKLAEYFIPEGTIAKLKYKDPENDRDIVIENGMKALPYNVVLLVNENSASASELFSGAFQDKNAGTIIGTKTFGKGSMQSVLRILSGAGIKYTIAEFYSPNDKRVHTIGITPDIVVENTKTHITEDDLTELDFNKINDTSNGEHILALEEHLKVLGCFSEEPDTVYDEATYDAICYFQMMKNLDITGKPDMFTLVALVDIIYDFDIENDDQLKAAVNYLLKGTID